MRKKKEKRLKLCIFTCLSIMICMGIMYACTDESVEDGGGNSPNSVVSSKNKELTKDVAQQWYTANNKPVTELRSTKESSGKLVMPNWEKAKERKKGRYEVVETPLKVQQPIIMMDQETRDRIGIEDNTTKIENVARMVVIKDTKTGKIRNFIMLFIGSYDYLMNDKKIGKNNYLHREPDFDGTVLFLAPGKGLINGWGYKNGKINEEIAPSLHENNGIISLRSQSCSYVKNWYTYTVCSDVPGDGSMQWNNEWETNEFVNEGVCRQEQDYTLEYVCKDNGSGGGSGGSSGSGGGGTTIPPGEVDPGIWGPGSSGQDKEPDERTDGDCDGDAYTRASSAKNIMNKTNDIKNKVSSLKSSLKGNEEYAATISYNGAFSMSDVVAGSQHSSTTGLAANTIMVLHTHPDSRGVSGPSIKDIQTLLEGNSFFYSKYGENNYNLNAAIIFSFDGSEYLLTLADRNKAYIFLEESPYSYSYNNTSESFSDNFRKDTFNEIRENLENQGYSSQDSYDFALAYLLDSDETGLKLAKKTKYDNGFKELKTEYNFIRETYNPQKCI